MYMYMYMYMCMHMYMYIIIITIIIAIIYIIYIYTHILYMFIHCSAVRHCTGSSESWSSWAVPRHRRHRILDRRSRTSGCLR